MQRPIQFQEGHQSEPARKVVYGWGSLASMIIGRSALSLTPEQRAMIRYRGFDVLPTPPPGLDETTYVQLGRGASPRELQKELKDPSKAHLVRWFERLKGRHIPSNWDDGAREVELAIIAILFSIHEIYRAIVSDLTSLAHMNPGLPAGTFHSITVSNAWRSVGPAGIRMASALVQHAMRTQAEIAPEQQMFTGIVILPTPEMSLDNAEAGARTFATLMELDATSSGRNSLYIQVPRSFDRSGTLHIPTPPYEPLYLTSTMTEDGRSIGDVENLIAPVAQEVLHLGLGTIGLAARARNNQVFRRLRETTKYSLI